MSDVLTTAQPNQTAKELEQQRINSIRASFTKNKSEPYTKIDESENKIDNNTENNKEILDNDQKDSYISGENKNEKESGEDKPTRKNDLEEYEKVLNDQFGGDGRKAVKSWKESQKGYTKLRQQSKEMQQQIDALNSLLERNPKVEEILNLALEKGEVTDADLQNFLRGGREPQGKPNITSQESKLEIVDNVEDIDEQTLADSGLLDLSKKELLSSTEWDLARRQAVLTYAQRNLPNQIAKSAYQHLKQQIDDERRREIEQQKAIENQQKNTERYQKGIERVVDEFNLNFAGNSEHEKLLEDIEKLAVNFRDPRDRNLIHPNAIYLATLEVLNEKGIKVQPSVDPNKEAERAKQEAEKALEDKIGFNKTGIQPSNTQPKTIAEKLRQRHLQGYQKELQWRKDTHRISSD